MWMKIRREKRGALIYQDILPSFASPDDQANWLYLKDIHQIKFQSALPSSLKFTPCEGQTQRWPDQQGFPQRKPERRILPSQDLNPAAFCACPTAAALCLAHSLTLQGLLRADSPFLQCLRSTS